MTLAFDRTAPHGNPGRATTDRPAAPHRLTTGPGSLEGLSDRPAGGPRRAPPTLRLEEWFHGTSRAQGIFQDRFGTVRRQFAVDLTGTWDGRELTLVEDFDYDDGERERRTWRIAPVGAHGYRGTAEGVVGTAEGAVTGPMFRWRYRFALPIGGRKLVVAFDDRMVLSDDGTLINRARVRKFGLLLGEATLVFRKT